MIYWYIYWYIYIYIYIVYNINYIIIRTVLICIVLYSLYCSECLGRFLFRGPRTSTSFPIAGHSPSGCSGSVATGRESLQVTRQRQIHRRTHALQPQSCRITLVRTAGTCWDRRNAHIGMPHSLVAMSRDFCYDSVYMIILSHTIMYYHLFNMATVDVLWIVYVYYLYCDDW